MVRARNYQGQLTIGELRQRLSREGRGMKRQRRRHRTTSPQPTESVLRFGMTPIVRKMSLVSIDFDPEGRSTIAQRFIAGKESLCRSPFRPVGTVESLTPHFGRPYGTCWQRIPINPLPSSELLGYCPTSLRDENENVANDNA